MINHCSFYFNPTGRLLFYCEGIIIGCCKIFTDKSVFKVFSNNFVVLLLFTFVFRLSKCEWKCDCSHSCSPGEVLYCTSDGEMNRRWTADGKTANQAPRLRRHVSADWPVAPRAPALIDSLHRWLSLSLFSVTVVLVGALQLYLD